MIANKKKTATTNVWANEARILGVVYGASMEVNGNTQAGEVKISIAICCYLPVIINGYNWLRRAEFNCLVAAYFGVTSSPSATVLIE